MPWFGDERGSRLRLWSQVASRNIMCGDLTDDPCRGSGTNGDRIATCPSWTAGRCASSGSGPSRGGETGWWGGKEGRRRKGRGGEGRTGGRVGGKLKKVHHRSVRYREEEEKQHAPACLLERARERLAGNLQRCGPRQGRAVNSSKHSGRMTGKISLRSGEALGDGLPGCAPMSGRLGVRLRAERGAGYHWWLTV